MFELSVAAKYLMPRWRQLSVSIISLISILVIALVVWLIVVFFSVTNGLTNSWIDKLIALTAPVRIIPTENYYKSYYYLADSISSKSDYNLKTIGEKLAAPESDPYDPSIDEEPPLAWRAPDRHSDGSLKDPVKLAMAAISDLKGVSGLKARDYEMTVANLRLRMLRQQPLKGSTQGKSEQQQGFLNQASYLGSLDNDNPNLAKALLPLSMADINNILSMLSVASDNIQEDAPDRIFQADKTTLLDRLFAFFDLVHIRQLQTPSNGWALPESLLPEKGLFTAGALMSGDRVLKVVIPPRAEELPHLQKIYTIEGYKFKPVLLENHDKHIVLKFPDGSERPLPPSTLVAIAGALDIPVQLQPDSIPLAKTSSDVLFSTKFSLQNHELEGVIPLGSLKVLKAELKTKFDHPPAKEPFWIYQVKSADQGDNVYLPSIKGIGDSILLPKSFRESGALVGDTGYLSYYTPTASSLQEQRIPVFVAGFYDPGIIPIGGKYILTNKDVTSLIRASHNQDDNGLSNGINIRFADRDQADRVKLALDKAFNEAGIAPYWKIETFREYEFTKDILQQLRSEKRLFTLLATLIILVACSNIISMLIILVNDKKQEIGILRSMGAASASIAAIFGICGVVMGVIGSILGTLAAVATLQNIQAIVDFISKMQGYDMFNPVFYGDNLPTDVSFEALTFVIIATAALSLIAGIVPAVKASLLRPSVILRSE